MNKCDKKRLSRKFRQATVSVGSMIILLLFSVAHAQDQAAYVVVHAANPEGIEIASIEKVNVYSVPIYDGDTLIGLSAYDGRTQNKPIEISPGTHTIKAVFNGVTKEQTITLDANEIRIITFTFERTDFDLAGYFDSIGGSFKDISREVTWHTPATECETDVSPDPFNSGINLCINAFQIDQEIPMTFSWKANGEAGVILNKNQFKLNIEATAEITEATNCQGNIGLSAFLDDELYLPFDLPSTTDFFTWFVQDIQHGWWPRVFLEGDDFHIRGIMTGWTGLPDGTQVPYEGYHLITLPTYIDYTTSSFHLYYDFPEESIPLEEGGGIGVNVAAGESNQISYEGTLHGLKLSSVPYDITGSGISAGEGDPQGPASAQALSIPSGIKVYIAGSATPYSVYGGDVAPQDIYLAYDILNFPERYGYQLLGTATSTEEFNGSYVWYLVVAMSTGGGGIDAFEFLGTSRYWNGWTYSGVTVYSFHPSDLENLYGPPDGKYSSCGYILLPGVDLIETDEISGIVYKDEDSDENYDAEVDIPIPNAAVEAVLDEEVKGSAITDENGEYSISGLPEGDYTVEVTYELCDQNAIESVEPIEFSVPASNDVNINVEYLPVDCGSALWELWHYGPVFDTDNVVLVHGVQLPRVQLPFFGSFGGADNIGGPDNHFENIHIILQGKENGQFNVWLFEYADKGTGYTYGHCENYSSRLKDAIDDVNQINSDKETGTDVSSIIAHSMGGIISRKCLQDNSSLWEKVKLLTLATGHFGFEATHWAKIVPWCNPESVRDMLPDGSYLWDLNFNYQQGSYVVASIAGTDDPMVKESCASLVQSPADRQESVSYPGSHYFATIPGNHGINSIGSENDDAFPYIQDFLAGSLDRFDTRPPVDWIPGTQGWRPYVMFCAGSPSVRPRIALVDDDEEIGWLSGLHVSTRSERGWARDSDGTLRQGYIWMCNTPSTEDYDSIRIYHGEREYLQVRITPGQSMIVRELVGDSAEEEIPTVGLSITPISAENGGRVFAGSNGLYTEHSIYVPADALSEDTAIQISEPEDNQVLTSAVEIGPGGTTFSEPATITAEYKDSDIPAGYNEENMRLLVWEDSKWNEVPGSVVDAEANTVSGQVSHLSVFAAGTPGVIPTVPDDGDGDGGGGGGCSIATAAFGSPMESHVSILRNFRDTYLLPCALGRIFVRTYNQYSPPLAHFIGKHEILKVAVRISLLPLVGISYSILHFGPAVTLTMLVLLLVTPIFLVSFCRRKARSHRTNN